MTLQDVQRLGLDPKHSWRPRALPWHVPITHKHLKHLYVRPAALPGEKIPSPRPSKPRLTMKGAFFSPKAVFCPVPG